MLKTTLALTLLCASLAACLPPPPPRTTTPPTQAELEAQAARRAERRARWRRALVAMAQEDEHKAKPYRLDCSPDGYGGTVCRDQDDQRIRCSPDGYGGTRCEEDR